MLAKREDLGAGNVIKAAGSSYHSGGIRKIIFFPGKSKNPVTGTKPELELMTEC